MKALIAKYQKDLLVEELPSYAGVKLDEESRNLLLKEFPAPTNWRSYAHHMTIKLGALDPNTQRDFGVSVSQRVQLQVVAVGLSERAFAVQVKGVKSTNRIPHVTIAVSPDGKPRDSNDITEWKPVTVSLTLSGVVFEHKTVAVKKEAKPSPSSGKKLNIGSLILKHHSNINKASLPSAIQQVFAWMKSQSMDNSESNALVIEAFIQKMEL